MLRCCVQTEVDHAKQNLYNLQQELFAKAQAAEAKEQERAADAAAEQAAQRAQRAREAAVTEARQREVQQSARRVRLAYEKPESKLLLGFTVNKEHTLNARLVQGMQQCLERGLLVLMCTR